MWQLYSWFVYTLHNAGPITYYNAYYGVGDGPTVWSRVNCFGWEKSLSQCSKNVFPSYSCYPTQSVGVVCKEGRVDL